MSGHVSDVIKIKGDNVLTIDHSKSVFDALEIMIDHSAGSVVVVDGESVSGIFTERDFIRRVALQCDDPRKVPLDDVMTKNVIAVEPGSSIVECMAIMTKKRIRHLPVMVDGKLAGLLSIGDCVKQINSEADAEIRYLNDYISGRYSA
jgi:CBS domain-containing protein